MAHPERKIKSKQIRRAHQEMERDERLLDEMRGRIELGWSEHKKTPYASKLASAKLIDIVRALDKEVLGIALLPSTACILRIVDIAKNAYSKEERSAFCLKRPKSSVQDSPSCGSVETIERALLES